VLCAARLHKQKNHALLIDAFATMSTRAVLVLLGDGPEREALVSKARERKVQDRVYLLGEVPNPYPLMRAADVVVLASRWEGMGLVAVEAAALGRPFIGTDVAGLREICGMLGQSVVPADDASALSAELDSLLRKGPAVYDDAMLEPFEPAEVASHYLRLLIAPAP